MDNRDLVLIVTDKGDLKQAISDSLGDEFRLIILKTVPEALSAITLKLPNLFIADINISGKSGIDLLKKIRQGIKTRLIPFILMTHESAGKDKLEALQMGADDYIVYPFVMEELKAIVRMRINKFKEFYLLSTTDELTRLSNRRDFNKKFQEITAENLGCKLSLGILDIDCFKRINDNYGHQTGDLVLMKLADILKEKLSDNFYPARFGGEEFVILFPSCDIYEARNMMSELLSEFSSTVFIAKDQKFKVTFSAGISEYPTNSKTLSELLKRADQALYTAKLEGRNKICSYNQYIKRNDKFWRCLTAAENGFITENYCDALSSLPYLPSVLEFINKIDFDVKSIGIVVIKIHLIEKALESINNHLFKYDLENLRIIISRSFDIVFPSDTYLCISDFFSNEYTLLFPSISDLSSDLQKFNEICRNVMFSIKESFHNFYIEISYNSGVVFIDKNDLYNIYGDIDKIRLKKYQLTSNRQKVDQIITLIMNNHEAGSTKDLFEINFFYDQTTKKTAYQSLRLKEFPYNDLFSIFINNTISIELLYQLGRIINYSKVLKKDIPLLIPYITSIDISLYVETIAQSVDDQNLVIMFNEYDLTALNTSLPSLYTTLPSNIKIGLDNCYISKEIFNIISMNEFSVIIFSESLLRNLHLIRERISIINGLKIFLDQVELPSLAKCIRLEEEYELLSDLQFRYFSGPYPDSIFLF